MERSDADWADLILGMQGHHGVQIARRWPEVRSKVRLLGDYLPGPPHAIEDPWGRDDAVFRANFERIALAVEGLGARLGRSAPLELHQQERASRSSPDMPG